MTYTGPQMESLGARGLAFRVGATWGYPTATLEDLVSSVFAAARAPESTHRSLLRYLERRALQLRGAHAPPGEPGPTEVYCSQCGRACGCAPVDDPDDDEPIKGDPVLDGSSSAGNPGPSGIADATGSLASAVAFDVRAAGKVLDLEGEPSTYLDDYDVHDAFGAFTERMATGAFAGCVNQDVMFQFDHGGMPLARTPGTLTLWDTPRALRCRATLSDTQLSRDLYEAIRRGDVSTMSIGFVCGADSWSDDFTRRVISRVDRLIDVSAVGLAANPFTSVWAVGTDPARARRRDQARRRLHDIKTRRSRVRQHAPRTKEMTREERTARRRAGRERRQAVETAGSYRATRRDGRGRDVPERRTVA
jgi:HK97 family phage prohead protease